MNFKKTILENGLRVITVPMKDNPTCTVLVLVETGSKYETKKLNGISHFLEHMCFKGTEKRPKAMDISRELDGLGSQYNAFTAQEYTGYYAKSDAKHFKQIFDVVSDIYLNSTFPEAEMEKEKGVIIEEINMYEDMPHRHVQDMIMQVLYGDQPAGWNIAGERENICAMVRSDFVNYKKAHYVPSATTIVVAGSVKEADVRKEVEKVFGTIKKSKKDGKVKTLVSKSGPKVLIKNKKTDQTHFVLAMHAYDLFNKKNPALNILASILGGGMSSRLFGRVREEMGAGYYVRSYCDPYTDHGYLEISAGVDNKRFEEVLKVCLEECKKLTTELVSAEELARVKEFIIGNTKLSLESTDDIANFFGAQELLQKKVETLEEKITNIRQVSAKDIQKIAREIFTNDNLYLALIGPFETTDSARFKKLLKF